MVELSLRLLLAGILVFVAGATGHPPFLIAAQIGLLQCSLAWIVSRIDKKQMRTPAVAGLIASADAVMIAFMLASMTELPALETFAIVALAPIIIASAKYRANPFLMAPVAAAGLVIADMAFNQWRLPSYQTLGHSLAFLLIGCLVKPSPVPSIVLAQQEQESSEPRITLAQIHAENQLLELRENFRQLRDSYRDLDRKSRKDRVAALLAEARIGLKGSTYFRLAEKIMDASGVTSSVLYTVAQYGEAFIVKGAAGEVNETQLTESMPIHAKQAIALIREQADQLSQSYEQEKRTGNIVLQNEGKVVGLITLCAPTQNLLFEAFETLEPCIALIAQIVLDEQRREAVERRLTETEVLYAVVVNADGANTKAEIASRVAKDFQSVLHLDHLAIHGLSDDHAHQLACEGREMDIMEAMRFDHGRGLQGWLDSGNPEVRLIDVRTDETIPSEFVVKNRVGSIIVIPIGNEARPTGYISAASARIAGIDMSEIETLRAAAAELARLFEKPDQPEIESDGLLTPKQFVDKVGKMEGVMVTLIPVQVKELEMRFGKPAMAHALRTLSLRIRPHVPSGSYMCRHPDGMFLVYLPGYERGVAMDWANEIAAIGPSSGIRTPDGSTRIPLQLRVKVAALSPQLNQFLVKA